jgi:hypothetical protein
MRSSAGTINLFDSGWLGQSLGLDGHTHGSSDIFMTHCSHHRRQISRAA